jgi:hypothetical protein
LRRWGSPRMLASGPGVPAACGAGTRECPRCGPHSLSRLGASSRASIVGSSISSRNTWVKRSASSSSFAAPPQTYSVAGAAVRISTSRRAGSHSQLCWASQAKSGTDGSSTTLPSESTDRASIGSPSASTDARLRRASTAHRCLSSASREGGANESVRSRRQPAGPGRDRTRAIP